MVTIDGEDAKILTMRFQLKSLTMEITGGVHIADSYYVTEDPYLDKEALKRGTSVYLVTG